MRWQQDKLRTIFPFHLALGSILALWVFLAASADVADPDIWWHLLNAKYLFMHGALPRFDTFAYTTLGDPWMNHEWLSEVPYYLAWQAFGFQGPYVVYLTLVELVLLGVFYLSTKTTGNVKGAFLTSCLAVILARVSFGPRTLLFGWLYLTILLLILRRFRTAGRGPLWAVPILFCLWVNSHGSWLIGLTVFGIFIAAGLVERSWGKIDAVRWTPPQLRQLLTAAAASLAALFVNPFGYRLVFYPFDLAYRQKLTVTYVEEWLSVDFHTPRGKIVMMVLAALLLGALASRVRWKLEEVALCMLGVYSGITYSRFLFLAAILLTPLLTKFLHRIPPYKPEIDKPLLNAAFLAGVVCVFVLQFPSDAKLEKTVTERFPQGAMTYLDGHPLDGHVFNYYMWGGYITLHHPEIKTFVDSRSDIFEYRGVLQDYMDAISLKKSVEVLDKYKVRYALFPPAEPISYFLRHTKGWRPAYEDSVSVLWERVEPLPGVEPVSPSVETRQSPPENDKPSNTAPGRGV
jgi:hypothetical protein